MKIKGFTIIETIIAITLSGVVFSAILGTYVVFQRTEITLDRLRILQKQTNFALSRIVDKSRDYNLDTLSANCLNNTHLCLRNNNELIIFLYEDENIFMIKDSIKEPLFSRQFKVTEASFNKDITNHPLINIQINVQDQKGESLPLFIETSISSRSYK